MTGVVWSLVDVFSQLLERDEREAVRGDLAEAGDGAWHGLSDVAGLVIRRQVLLWKNWRPWLAAFRLALPGSFFLVGFFSSVCSGYEQILDPEISVGPGFLLAGCD